MSGNIIFKLWKEVIFLKNVNIYPNQLYINKRRSKKWKIVV